jgi:hypothetical protein
MLIKVNKRTIMFIKVNIDKYIKNFYFRGLKEWKNEKGYLIDTCLSGQGKYIYLLDLFQIKEESK